MTIDWPKHKLSEFINIKHGFAYKGEFFSDSETNDYLLTPGNFAIGGGFQANKFKCYDGPTPDSYVLRGGELIVTMTDLSKQGDTLGYSALVPSIKGKRLLHNQRIGLVEFLTEDIDKCFLYFLLRSREYRNLILSTATGSTVKHTSPTKICQFTFRKPPLEIQQEIGKHLITLEKKVEVNRQINQTLEAMVQAIFKSWFVDFEPVKAKIASIEVGEDANGVTRAAMRSISGKTDEELDQLRATKPEHYKQLKNTAELFPSSMQSSDFGEIPNGWEPSSVGAEFDVTMGQSPPGHTYNQNGEGEPFFQGKSDFDWRYPENRVYCTQPKRMAKKGDTLLSVRAPVGDINKATSDCCIGRGIAALRHKSGCEAYTYYSMMNLNGNFQNFNSEGTVFGSINQKDLKAIKVLRPLSSVVEAFSHIAGTIDQQILNFEIQNRILSQLRDTLLPKLLSGELSVDATGSTEASI